jgi:hypothetical protein
VDTAPRDVGAALVALETVTARLRAVDDARAVFPDVYAVITRRVARALAEGGTFLEPAWIARLAGDFAERYFAALVPSIVGPAPARAPVPAAWRVAFAAGAHGPRLPVRDALLGINAHVNHDLARGIAATLATAGHWTDDASLVRHKHDHDAIDGLLRAGLPEIEGLLLHRYGCRATWLATRARRADNAATEAALALVEGWRATVWGDALALVRGSAAERAARAARIDAHAARIARALAGSNPAWVVGVLAARVG